jgi:Transcriptional regulators
MKIDELINVLYQLKISDLNVTELFKAQTDLNLTRYVILLYLNRNGKKTQSEIQKSLQINGSAISRHLKDLESNGYVTRVRNPENNREVVVELTDFAKEKVANCGQTPEDKEMLKLFNATFTPNEIELLSELLGRLGDLKLK